MQYNFHGLVRHVLIRALPGTPVPGTAPLPDIERLLFLQQVLDSNNHALEDSREIQLLQKSELFIGNDFGSVCELHGYDLKKLARLL